MQHLLTFKAKAAVFFHWSRAFYPAKKLCFLFPSQGVYSPKPYERSNIFDKKLTCVLTIYSNTHNWVRTVQCGTLKIYIIFCGNHTLQGKGGWRAGCPRLQYYPAAGEDQVSPRDGVEPHLPPGQTGWQEQIPASSCLPQRLSATDLTASATVTISKKIIEYENSINFQSFNDCHTFRFQIINNRFNFFCLHFISFVLQEYQEYPLRLGFQEGCFPAL